MDDLEKKSKAEAIVGVVISTILFILFIWFNVASGAFSIEAPLDIKIICFSVLFMPFVAVISENILLLLMVLDDESEVK